MQHSKKIASYYECFMTKQAIPKEIQLGIALQMRFFSHCVNGGWFFAGFRRYHARAGAEGASSNHLHAFSKGGVDKHEIAWQGVGGILYLMPVYNP